MSCLTIVNRKEKFQFQATVTLEQLNSVPFVNGVIFAKLRLVNNRHQRKYSERVPLQDHMVQWNTTYDFTFRLMRNSECVLESCFLKISIRQEVRGGKASVKLGYVNVDLSCFVGNTVRRRYILNGYDQRQRQNNALLCLTFAVRYSGGISDNLWRLPSESTVYLVPLEPSEVCPSFNGTTGSSFQAFPHSTSTKPHIPTTNSLLATNLASNPSIHRFLPSTEAPPPIVSGVDSGRIFNGDVHLAATTNFADVAKLASHIEDSRTVSMLSSQANVGTIVKEDEKSETEGTEERWEDVPEGSHDDCPNEVLPCRKNSNDSWKSFSEESIQSESPYILPSSSSSHSVTHPLSVHRPNVLSVIQKSANPSDSQRLHYHTPPSEKRLSPNGFPSPGSLCYPKSCGTSSRDDVGTSLDKPTHQRHPSSLSGISLVLSINNQQQSFQSHSSTGGSSSVSHNSSPAPIAMDPSSVVRMVPTFNQNFHALSSRLVHGSGVIPEAEPHLRHHMRQSSLDSGNFCEEFGSRFHCQGYRGGYTASGVYDPSLERTRDKDKYPCHHVVRYRSEEKQLLLDATRANNDELVSQIIRLNLQRPDKNSSLSANNHQGGHRNS